jgi:glutamate/tyrosine decarboxylase-like PLP-dependent enzyme
MSVRAATARMITATRRVSLAATSLPPPGEAGMLRPTQATGPGRDEERVVSEATGDGRAEDASDAPTGLDHLTRLPEWPFSNEEVLEYLSDTARRQDAFAQGGRVSGSIYHGGEEHFAFLGEVSSRFSHMNVLQRDLYPAGLRFESEIVSMTAAMLHGGPDVCGAITSGGTESIITSVLAYRDAARARRGEEHPELVMAETAHPAFEKGCHYFGVRCVKVPCSPLGEADVEAMRRAVTPRTIALVGSAGDYAYGGVDDIPALGQVALEHGVGLHVDGCLGGFILPWLVELGAEVPPFDLAVPGVTTMSADTHKYGYAPKGSSVLLYQDAALREFQGFQSPEWPGGRYGTPGIGGSRSHAQIAATWAAMATLGARGYREIARGILATAHTIRAGVDANPDLNAIRESSFIAAFASDTVDVYLANDLLKARGWRLNVLQRPPALHFCVTRPNTQPGIAEALVDDLAAATAYARERAGETAASAPRYASGGERG